MSDDRLPTATLVAELRKQAGWRVLADPQNDDASLYRQAADRLEEMTAAVDAARAEERERCAKVADAFAVHQYADPKLVAAAIRKGPTP